MDIPGKSSFITCRQCRNVFINPKILYCGHTFCSKCLTDLFEGVADNDGTNTDSNSEVSDEMDVEDGGSSFVVRKFSCPTCNKSIKFDRSLTVNDLKPNYFIEELISVKQNLPNDMPVESNDFLTEIEALALLKKCLSVVDDRLKMLSEDGNVMQQKYTIFRKNVSLVKKQIKHSKYENEQELLNDSNRTSQQYRDHFYTKKILNRITKFGLENFKESMNDCLLYKNFDHFVKIICPEYKEYFYKLRDEPRNIEFPKIKCKTNDDKITSLRLTFPNDKYKISFRNETKVIKVLKTSEKPRSIAYRANRNQLFVIFSGSNGTHISIYNCSNYDKLNITIKLNQICNANDALVVKNFLFITERTGQILHKIDCSAIDEELMKPKPKQSLEIYQTMGWYLSSYNDGLSGTYRRTLLISGNQSNELLEYELTNCCLSKVAFADRSLTNPRHAIVVPDNVKQQYEMQGLNNTNNSRASHTQSASSFRSNKKNDYYVVCLAGATHKCLIINSHGEVIRETLAELNFRHPICLAGHHRNKYRDGEDFEIIVCDRMNSRLVLLDMDLNYVKKISPLLGNCTNDLTNRYKFKKPLKTILIKNDEDYDEYCGDVDDDAISLVIADEDNSCIVVVKPVGNDDNDNH